MWGCYRLDAVREVESAGHCYFRIPSVHPDRVMRYHDLIYLMDGEWTICQGSESFTMRPGQILILHAGQHHFGAEPCRAGTRTMYVHVSDGGDRILHDAGGTEEPGALPSLIDCGDNTRIRRLFTDLIYYRSARSGNRDTVCSATAQLLFCELSDIVHGRESSSRVVYRTIRYIQDNPGRFLREDELSEHLAVSGRTLRDRFRAATGVTPYRYQMDLKLHAVAGMLVSFPEMTLRELALNYGFFDEFHLSKAFKRQYGISPAEYRKRSASAGPAS